MLRLEVSRDVPAADMAHGCPNYVGALSLHSGYRCVYARCMTVLVEGRFCGLKLYACTAALLQSRIVCDMLYV